jgi:hypothetical protein
MSVVSAAGPNGLIGLTFGPLGIGAGPGCYRACAANGHSYGGRFAGLAIHSPKRHNPLPGSDLWA